MGGTALLLDHDAFLGIILIVIGILAAVTTYGLGELKDWGYKLAIVFYFIAAYLQVVSLFYRGLLRTVSMVIILSILVYLFMPGTKAKFGQT